MPITVDEAYLNRLATIMRDLSGQAPAASGGEIDNMTLRLGHNNFPAGQQLASLLHTRGGEIQQRLVELGETAGNRGVELQMFLQLTGNTEDVNDLTAAEFGSQLPSWSSGGGDGGGGAVAGPEL
ncbi:MAG: hypothetical protein ACRDT4_04145 [Micromonosporaceae bacterium]